MQDNFLSCLIQLRLQMSDLHQVRSALTQKKEDINKGRMRQLNCFHQTTLGLCIKLSPCFQWLNQILGLKCYVSSSLSLSTHTHTHSRLHTEYYSKRQTASNIINHTFCKQKSTVYIIHIYPGITAFAAFNHFYYYYYYHSSSSAPSFVLNSFKIIEK